MILVNMKKINVITLGCSKNLVDSELFLAQLRANGFEVAHDSNSEDARIVAVNTCGFILDAKKESIEAIMDYVAAKNAGRIDKLFVFGCLSARYRDDLVKEIPEVDGFYGKFEIPGMVQDLNAEYKFSLSNHRYLTTPSHYAYLKISEGCNRNCSYCAIPGMAGKHISKPIEALVDETMMLAGKGVKELLIIAQDLSSYGTDLYGTKKLPGLVERLSDISELEWIKLHYAYPAGFPLDLLKVIQERDNVAGYLDIAFQHISDHMLKMMKRYTSKKQALELIEKIRREVPGIHLRTTVLVGHPGEAENDFNELKDFVKDVEFERLGVFPYSHEEDTFAGKNYVDDIPEETKQERADEIMKIQQEISMKKCREKVGQVMKVIIDREEGGYFVGRTEFDSPEVDGEVYVSAGDYEPAIGRFCNVEITKADDYDLYGIPV